MTEGEGENFYTQTDHLASIGFQAQPGDIYYMNPPKELTSYPMFIDNPKKTEKPLVGSFIAYTLDGTDITEKLVRRYSDFFTDFRHIAAIAQSNHKAVIEHGLQTNLPTELKTAPGFAVAAQITFFHVLFVKHIICLILFSALIGETTNNIAAQCDSSIGKNTDSAVRQIKAVSEVNGYFYRYHREI